jgi:HEAT repeats
MKKLMLSGLCCASLMALLPETGRAHGGQYRGPGDVVPPSPGGGGRTGGPAGPTTGGPAGPSAPGPSGPATGGPAGPSTGGPAGPAGGRGPQTGGRGAQLEDDLTRWDFWWEFNKDPFIRLRDAVLAGGAITGSDDFYLGSTRRSEAKDSMRPSDADIMGEILPALRKALGDWERTSGAQVDIPSSCMVAMAKIGKDHNDFKLVDVFKPQLKAGNQELRESAALSLGIAAMAGEEEVKLLTGLVLEDELGKTVSGGAVNQRTRTFAAYGLGLLAYRTETVEIKQKAFDALKVVLNDDKVTDRNVKVGAIQGISILNIPNGPSAKDAEKQLLADALTTLEGYYMKSLGSGEQLIQSHVPPSIAKLIGRDHEKSEYYKELFAADLQEKGKVKRSSIFIPQSCVMAIGLMAKPYDDKDDKKNPDNKYSKLLLDTWKDHKDLQTKNFAMMGLGLIGGSLNKDVILKEFDKGNKNQQKPWCALALGVYSHFKYEAQKENSELETFIGETLASELKTAKDPSLVGALAISLGLTKFSEAADEMRKRMIDNIPNEQMAGYLAIGLALMNDRRSIEDLNNTVLPQSTRRFDLLQQAAIALGKLGDKKVADTLQALMTDGEPNLAKLSAIASAIGFIGDKRTIQPLKRMLFDDKLTEISRAFAAVALGGIADKEMLPWNTKIGVNSNYRASVETLTNKQNGILDIL